MHINRRDGIFSSQKKHSDLQLIPWVLKMICDGHKSVSYIAKDQDTRYRNDQIRTVRMYTTSVNHVTDNYKSRGQVLYNPNLHCPLDLCMYISYVFGDTENLTELILEIAPRQLKSWFARNTHHDYQLRRIDRAVTQSSLFHVSMCYDFAEHDPPTPID